MPRMSQLQWWLEKEPDLEKAKKLWKQHQQSIADKRAQKVKEKFELISNWGNWEVLHPIVYKQEKMPAGRIRNLVKVKCKCGKEDFIDRANLMSGRSNSCRGCYHRGSLNSRWNGHGDMPGDVYHRISSSAKNRNIELNVTREQLHNLLHKQNFKCALTGQSLNWKTASLDRIDSNKAYDIDNIQWMLSEVNYMKRVLTQDRFIELCKLVAENN
jgi:hypothetical protein